MLPTRLRRLVDRVESDAVLAVLARAALVGLILPTAVLVLTVLEERPYWSTPTETGRVVRIGPGEPRPEWVNRSCEDEVVVVQAGGPGRAGPREVVLDGCSYGFAVGDPVRFARHEDDPARGFADVTRPGGYAVVYAVGAPVTGAVTAVVLGVRETWRRRRRAPRGRRSGRRWRRTP